jgi:uncharacterized membrane protein YdjX (TVP38/TMEM64 family)
MREPLRRFLRFRGLCGLALVFGLGWLLLEALERAGGPEAVRARWGLAAGCVLVPLQAVVAVTPFPSEVVAAANGALYGVAWGSGFAWAGWMLGALIEYALYRRVAEDVSDSDAVQRLPRWLRRFPAHHPAFLVGGRLVPFGNHVVNAVAGMRGVPLWRFCWVSALAFVPFSVLFTMFAAGVVSR